MPVEETNESAKPSPEGNVPAPSVVKDAPSPAEPVEVTPAAPLPSEPVEVAPDAEQQPDPIDAGADEVPPVDPQDETDVHFALSRETADGSGFDSDKDAEMLESDFESFASDDVEADDDEANA